MPDVSAYLGRYGPQPAGRLREALGLTKSSLHRALATAQDVMTVGKARATWYAARRSIAGVITPIEVFELDQAGVARCALRLHPVEPFGHYVESCCEDVESGFHEHEPGVSTAPLDLPWFLADLRPGGFLGRAWARAHGDQGFPADPIRWTGDHVLRYACLYGHDLPGALVLGRFALEARDRVPLLERRDLAVAAKHVLEASEWGSSAGGDQPKFTVSTSEGGSIVKFSPPLDLPSGRRWGDLLVAEHVIHGVLREQGFEAPESRISDAGGRRFLEVSRFDRHGAKGRSGVVSLLPLDRDDVGSDQRRWSLVTARLVKTSRLSAADHARVLWLEAFGHQIANTDMHLGNLSLRLRGTRILGLAPIYDMLPMYYAPGYGGEIRTRRFHPNEEPPPGGVLAAARLAWRRIATHLDVSEDFQAIAADHGR